MKTIYRFLLLMMLLTSVISAFSQSTVSPDSVCSGAIGKIYKVTGTPGNTCHWSLTGGGTIHTTVTSDSITIDWSSSPGIDTIKVVETNPIGCFGDTVVLAVVRIPLPTVALSGTDSICQYSSTTMSKLRMDMTGLPPWTISYTEDGTSRSVTTSTTPYNFNSQVFSTSGVKSYALTSVTSRLGCTGTTSGSASVTVLPKPLTSSIIHY